VGSAALVLGCERLVARPTNCSRCVSKVEQAAERESRRRKQWSMDGMPADLAPQLSQIAALRSEMRALQGALA